MESVYLIIVLAPLVAALVAGFLGAWVPVLGRRFTHWITIIGVAISFVLSFYVLKGLVFDGVPAYDGTVYQWADVGPLHIQVGFMIDRLSALMMTVVTFVSLAVHVYTIGYMDDDPGYKRFFSYISLFTFSMLMLVMSNNLMQLFFGWEAVGLVSYLLIGFWYKKPTATAASIKAFIVNRVGDMGFVLGIAAVLKGVGSLDYSVIFQHGADLQQQTITLFSGMPWSLGTVACLCFFVGAMGKSAQAPLHVWLPDSMEGPTPISALIHAATMVTAGIFMVARMSPIFEYSQVALTVVLVIGATTAFFMGVVGVVQQDIKRVIAYSTLSQLGYMTAGLGASIYAGSIFHLMTHAFFKALLFLGAGSVIIAMHHDQDIRNMGGLRKYMPITYATFLVGTLALIAFPGFSGFFSKDALIEAIGLSTVPGSTYGYWCVLLGVFVTSLYSFRLLFVVFHGKERMSDHVREHLHETRPVVTGPLIALAIPSVLVGWTVIKPLLFGGFFGKSIFVLPQHDALAQMAEEWHGSFAFLLHAFTSVAFYLALAGFVVAWYCYLKRPDIPGRLLEKYRGLHTVLINKYYFDWFNENVLARGLRGVGTLFWRVGDQFFIDTVAINGSAWTVDTLARVGRRMQSGYLYHYAFAMVIGLAALIGWFVFWS